MSFFGGRRQHEDNEDKAAAASSKPAAPPAPRQPVGFETVLGANTHITGDFHGSGNARFDGILDGKLEIDGNVLIGETAKITADVNARNISIAGAVRGNIHGNKVQILRTGRVWGDIHAAAITTEEGAFIDGKITMVSHEAAVQKLETPPLAEPALAETPDVLEEPDFIAEVDAAREAEAEAETEADAAPEFGSGMMNLFGSSDYETETDEEAPIADDDEGLDFEAFEDENTPRYPLD